MIVHKPFSIMQSFISRADLRAVVECRQSPAICLALPKDGVIELRNLERTTTPIQMLPHTATSQPFANTKVIPLFLSDCRQYMMAMATMKKSLLARLPRPHCRS